MHSVSTATGSGLEHATGSKAPNARAGDPCSWRRLSRSVRSRRACRRLQVPGRCMHPRLSPEVAAPDGGVIGRATAAQIGGASPPLAAGKRTDRQPRQWIVAPRWQRCRRPGRCAANARSHPCRLARGRAVSWLASRPGARTGPGSRAGSRDECRRNARRLMAAVIGMAPGSRGMKAIALTIDGVAIGVAGEHRHLWPASNSNGPTSMLGRRCCL